MTSTTTTTTTHPSHSLILSLILHGLCFIIPNSFAIPYEGPDYDSSAFTECKEYPEAALYNGGIFNASSGDEGSGEGFTHPATSVYSPAFLLNNLTVHSKYSFSCWVKIDGRESALVRARLSRNYNSTSSNSCIGTVIAKSGCWSFLKGGFATYSSADTAVLYFQSSGEETTEISIASASLQPFTNQQWKMQQEDRISPKRKRRVAIHVGDGSGRRVQGASITVQQVSKGFPFGSAIAKTIIGNEPYQNWFTKRFNAAVFENELKWYTTEPDPGKLNYTLADQLMSFVRANQITVRGHNIFWEDPKYTPAWVHNLSGSGLRSAVGSRISSLMSRYREEFIHWDVSNEMLHFDFYEQRLGPNATLHFFQVAQQEDPQATLFMNDFNVIETCEDANSTVDAYISRLQELKRGGAVMEGIGLEGHFSKPNIPLMRAILDKLGTLGFPVWLTEIDISNRFDHETQAAYLEEVLREGFSHPAVNGILLWSALHPYGCYQMCLTDGNFNNLPAGDVVDKLLQEWATGLVQGQTDDHGSFMFDGFIGEYTLSVNYQNQSTNALLSLCESDETKHFYVHI